MILVMEAADDARPGGRWALGLAVLLLSVAALAENAGRLDISAASADDRLTEEIYGSAQGWRKPPAYDSEWRPQAQEPQGRITFGYDSVYEEMRARDDGYSPNSGLGLREPRQNTQFRIGF